MQTSDKNTDLIELRAQNQQLKQNYKQLNEEQENLLILLQEMEAKTKKYKKQLRKLDQEVSDDELEDDEEEEESDESSNKNDQAAAPTDPFNGKIELGHDELTLKNNVLKINTNYSYNEDNDDLYPIQKASLGPIASAFEQNSSLASSRSENLNNNNTSSSSDSTNDSLHNHHGHSHDYNYVNPSMITLSPPTGQNFNTIQLNTNQFLYNPAQAPINSFYQPNLDQQSGNSPLQSYFK